MQAVGLKAANVRKLDHLILEKVHRHFELFLQHPMMYDLGIYFLTPIH